MEGLHSEPQQIGGIKTKAGEGAEALEEWTLPSETWSNNSNKTTRTMHSSEVVVEDSTFPISFSEPLLGLILKMPASLQPVCFSGSPVRLLAGGVEPQIVTPVIAPGPGSLTLPLILDQPHLQYLSPQLLTPSSCPVLEQQDLHQSLQCPSEPEQNNGLSQNPSMPLSHPQHGEGKSNISQPFNNPALHSSEFLDVLQELFPFLRNCSSLAYQGSSSIPSTGFLPPDSTLSYLYPGSPLVSLVPPATLLVPFPLIVPLPVPLPIPIPIPIPPFPDSNSLSRSSRAGYGMKKSKSTQTLTEDIPTCTHGRNSDYDFLQLPTQPTPPASQEEVLDLTVKVVPIQTKQEVQFPFLQDNVLDLSVGNKSSLKSCKGSKLKHHGRNSTNEELTNLIQPLKYSQKHGTNQLNGHSDGESGMQYKWTTEEHYENYTTKYPGQNGVITPKQTTRGTLSTKDAPVMFCEKLVRPPYGHVLKNRVVKLKRVNSQNISIPPIKKQHVMTFHPGK